jgi:hypothetical protein
MSNPHDFADSHQDQLQFDEAEFTEPAHAATTCTACKTPIADLYYEAGGKIVCDPCRHKIEALFHGGSRLGRAFRALVLGTLAAVAGAALYYAIFKITGRNFGLVAIVVGLMVGAAVKSGSGNRGGWFYQLMALFLTYSAIGAMLLPLALEQFQAEQQKQKAQFEEIVKKAQEESKKKGHGEAKAELKKHDQKPEVIAPQEKAVKGVPEEVELAKAQPANQPNAKPAEQPKAEPPDKAQAAIAAPKAPAVDLKATKAANPAADKETAKPAGPAVNVDDDDEEDEGPGIVDFRPNGAGQPAFLLLFIVGCIVFAYALPIIFAFGSPISGLIFAFALWEAWKLNKKVQLVINGPFNLAAADHPMDLAPEDLDDEQ